MEYENYQTINDNTNTKKNKNNNINKNIKNIWNLFDEEFDINNKQEKL